MARGMSRRLYNAIFLHYLKEEVGTRIKNTRGAHHPIGRLYRISVSLTIFQSANYGSIPVLRNDVFPFGQLRCRLVVDFDARRSQDSGYLVVDAGINKGFAVFFESELLPIA
jgi:hypothetical protein